MPDTQTLAFLGLLSEPKKGSNYPITHISQSALVHFYLLPILADSEHQTYRKKWTLIGTKRVTGGLFSTLRLFDTQYSDMFPQVILVCYVCHFSGLTIICCVAISDPNSNKTNNKNKHFNPFAGQNTVVIVTCKRTRHAWRRHWTL